jgi:ADP-heptose:LPS heptosyltransferase
MKTLLRKVWKAALESTTLLLVIKLYLDTVKTLYGRLSPPMRPSAKSIFVSFPYNSLGDVLALIPLLERIRIVWPDARLHVALGSVIAPFIDRISFIKVIPVTAVPHKGAILWRLKEIRQLVTCFRRDLCNEYYDIAISPRWGSDVYARASRYLMYLANSGTRISYSSTVDGGPSALDRLSTDLAFGGALEQESVRQIRVLERTAVTEPDKDVHSAVRSRTEALVSIAASVGREQLKEQIQNSIGRSIDKYIVVSPGASRATNRWPIERFQQVIIELHRQYQSSVLLVGDKRDAKICEGVAGGLPGIAFSLGGKTSLEELAAIIQGAKLFLGNDSGPAHMAGGLGVPCIVLTASAIHSDQSHIHSALRWRPNGPLVNVIQPLDPLLPCRDGCEVETPHCILQISAADVLKIAVKQLGGVSTR